MDNESVSVMTFSLKFGVAAGAALSLLMLGFFVAGMPESQIPQYIGYAIMIGAVLWGQHAYKNTVTGAVRYGQALGLGVMVMLYFGVVTTIYSMIHMGFLDVEFADRLLRTTEEALVMQGMSDEQIEGALAVQSKLITPVITPLLGFVSTMFFGLILSAITASFMKRA
jgi:hypothetical protein